MTQTQNLPTVFRVYGKDRLFDDWTPFESRFQWEVELWATKRAWVRYGSDGELLIERRTLDAQIRLEWLVNGVWEPYTAWYGPQHRAHVERSLARKGTDNPNNTFRLVERTDAHPDE